MAPKQPSTTTQITEVKLPAWVDAAAKKNYAFAEQIANKPYEAYTGQTVADTNQDIEDAFSLFKGKLGVGDANFSAANDLFAKQGAGIAGMDRSTYMNPYIDEVETKALGALDKQRVQALMSNADKAIAAKAFGGNRSAVVDAVTNAETADKAGILSANLRKDAFDNATSQMQGDLAAAGAAGQGQLATGNALLDQRNKDFTGLLGIGQQQQQQLQKELDDAKGRFDEEKNHDLESLNVLLSSLGMSPYGKTETATKTSQGGSSGTDFAQMGLGILSLLMGISDERMKTDIKKVGEDEETGLPLYSYRYKGDPKTYPKILGPMAQDVEKILPGAVAEVGGIKMVDKRVLGILGNRAREMA